MIFDFVARAKLRRCIGEITLTPRSIFCMIFGPGPYTTSKIFRRFAAGFCCFQKIYKEILSPAYNM